MQLFGRYVNKFNGRKKKKSGKKKQPTNHLPAASHLKISTMKKKSIKQLFASKFPVCRTTDHNQGNATKPHESLLPPS